MKTLASHMSQMMTDGRITDGRIYGIQNSKKKEKRTGMQGMAGTKTGSGSNKPLMGKDAPGAASRVKGDGQGPVMPTKMPKVKKPNLARPKKQSAFAKAYEDAKNTVQISTNSHAKAAGAKPTKGSTAKTKGAGID